MKRKSRKPFDLSESLHWQLNSYALAGGSVLAKKILLLAPLLLSVFLSVLLAQDSSAPPFVVPTNSSRHSVPELRSSMLYKIYSNLGAGKNPCYSQGGTAWLVGQGQSIAMPFTPKADAELTEIGLGFGHCKFCGPDGGTVTLYQDSNGVPGETIHIWRFRKLGTSKLESCWVTLGKSTRGLPLKKGKQYWVAASAPDTATDFARLNVPSPFPRKTSIILLLAPTLELATATSGLPSRLKSATTRPTA